MTVVVLSLGAPTGAPATAGDRDPSFGSNGFTILDASGVNERLADVVVLPDGKILAGGVAPGSAGFLLARLNTDGTPDTGFDDDGIRIEPDSGTAGAPRALSAIALQPDGKLVGAGLGRGATTNHFGFGRWEPGGETLDSGFGASGVRTLAPTPAAGGQATDVAVDPAGRIVGAGDTSSGLVAVVRLTSTGTPDPDFGGGDGVALTDIAGSSTETADAVVALPDSSLVVGGRSTLGPFLIKLKSDGTPEANFGTGGLTTFPGGLGEVTDLARLANGNFIAAGQGNEVAAGDTSAFASRITSEGDVDPTFGGGGTFRFNPTPKQDEAFALTVLPDDRILLAGMRDTNDVISGTVWLVRLTQGGQLDTSFGTGGEAFPDAVPANDRAVGLALQPDGKAVVAGFASDSGLKLLVGRFLADPPSIAPPLPNGPPGSTTPALDPDLRELELRGRLISPFGVFCGSVCTAEVGLASRGPVRLPHSARHRRAVVTLGRATLTLAGPGRRTVTLRAGRVARRLLRGGRPLAARLSVLIGGTRILRNLAVRQAQQRLRVNRRGRGRLRLLFRAEANQGIRATVTLRRGGRLAARARVTPTPGRSRTVTLGVDRSTLALLSRRGQVRATLTVAYRDDAGRSVRERRALTLVGR